MGNELFTVAGYAVFIIYTVGIMLGGILLESKTKINKTLCRKLTHIVSAFLWVICYFFFLHGTECTEPHMKQHRGNGTSFGTDGIQQFRSEVQTGGWCCG